MQVARYTKATMLNTFLYFFFKFVQNGDRLGLRSQKLNIYSEANSLSAISPKDEQTLKIHLG
jgi:hypothetical protein